MRRKESKKEHFARNAAEGRTGRVDLKLDLRHISDADLRRLRLPALEITIQNGTLTPEQAKRVYDALNAELAQTAEHR